VVVRRRVIGRYDAARRAQAATADFSEPRVGNLRHGVEQDGTMTPDRPETATSLVNELARERNREAADRTLLAWIRTSLALISLGFGIERLGQAAVGLDGRLAGFTPLKTRTFGVALILLGVAATLAGMWEHRHVLAAITSPDYRYAERPAIARFMGTALVVVGLAALVVVLVGF
jgi:putative membrane protein